MNKELFESLERECWKFDLKYEFPILFQGYISKIELLKALVNDGYDYDTIKINIKDSMETDLLQMEKGEKILN